MYINETMVQNTCMLVISEHTSSTFIEKNEVFSPKLDGQLDGMGNGVLKHSFR